MKDLIAGLVLVGGAVALGRRGRGLGGLGYSNEKHVVRGEEFLKEAEHYIPRAGDSSLFAVLALKNLTIARENFYAAGDPRSSSVSEKENEITRLILQRMP